MVQINVMRTDERGNVFWLLDTGQVQLKLLNRPPEKQLKELGYFKDGVLEVTKPAGLLFQKADAVCFNYAVIDYLRPTNLILHLTTKYISNHSNAKYTAGWYYLSIDSPATLLEQTNKINFKSRGLELQIIVPLKNFKKGKAPDRIHPKKAILCSHQITKLCTASNSKMSDMEEDQWCTIITKEGTPVDIVSNPVYVRSKYYLMASDLNTALTDYPLHMKTLVKRNPLK